MQIDNELERYQLVPLVFAQDAVAASQTAEALNPQAVHGGVALDNVGYTMPFEGWVVGVSAALSAAATVGSLTLAPTVATVAVTAPSLAMTTAAAGSSMAHRGANRFAKDAVIGCKVTTSGDWDGIASDLVAQVWVVLKVAGI